MTKTKLHIAFLLCLPVFGFGQVGQIRDTLTPSVISSAGGYNLVGGISLSYTVGEAVVTTLQNATPPDFFLTQGFQQPTSKALSIDLNVTNESCADGNDGSALLTIYGGVPPYSIIWTSKPGYNGTTLGELTPGPDTVQVKDANGLFTFAAFNIMASTANCQVHIYTGITPNGDGHNDTWVIDYIELYPDNTVTVYNRWGDEVWKGEGYDNTKVVWKGDNSHNNPLPDGTYFYIVTYDNITRKGWVQLTR